MSAKNIYSLPEPYEEVFIWWDSNSGIQRRVARLDAKKEFFQLSTYNGAARSQYLAPLKEVLYWAPIADGNAYADLLRIAELITKLNESEGLSPVALGYLKDQAIAAINKANASVIGPKEKESA